MIARGMEGEWQFDEEAPLKVDPSGMPLLADRAEWPLEA